MHAPSRARVCFRSHASQFYTDPPHLLGADVSKMPRTIIIPKELNPRWCDDADVPVLHLCVKQEDDLEHCHLLLAVFDKVRDEAEKLRQRDRATLARRSSLSATAAVCLCVRT